MNNSTSIFQTVYPQFILHKEWDMPNEFNTALAEIAKKDAIDNSVTDNSDPRNLGDTSNHFGHVRHNMLEEHKDNPVIKELLMMTIAAVGEYLATGYGYELNRDVEVIAETFYQRRDNDENVGIFTHSHLKSDLVVTYYPLVDIDEDYKNSTGKSGSLRFYDPAGVGNRLWGNKNPNVFFGSWYEIVPKTGSMVVFEGHMMHDSSYFEGNERVCIPIQCNIDTPNKQQKKSAIDLLGIK